MGEVKFIKANGRLKRTLPGFDHYTGLLFYNDVLPAGFSANDRIKEITNVTTAETLGITDDNADDGIKIMHYHISEFFRINPDAILYLAIYAVPAGVHTFDEVDTLRIFCDGKLRQIGVFTSKAYAVGDPDLLQGKYTNSFNEYAMHEIIYSPNLDGVADAALPDLAALVDRNVHLSIGQDGAALGKTLYDAAGYSVGVIGAILGAISLAKVHECIGWVEKFNMSITGGELDKPALSNGTLVKDLPVAYTKSEGTLDTKRLIFLKKYPSFAGSYFNDSHGAVSAADDYAYIEDNRTIDKAIRGVYTKMLPKVNGPVLLDKTTGKLSAAYVKYMETEGGKALDQMEKDGELSGYVVTVDPDQDVNATNKIIIYITNTKIGVSRKLEINIGY